MGRLVVMVAVLALAASAGADADVVEVTGWQVNVRERPSKSGAVLATLHRGERFELIERAGSWYHVRMVPSGRVGYVHSSLVRVIPGATLAASEPAPRPMAPRPAPVAPPAATPEPTIPPPAPAPITPAPAPRAAYVPPRQSPPPAPPPPEPDYPQREGFWIGFGLGYGSASVSADDSSGDGREGSVTGFLKLGGTLNHRVLLGVESNAWLKSQDDVTLTLGSVAGTVTFYPMPTSGFFVKGGLGLSYMSTDIFLDGATLSVSKVGWGLLVGVGYDWRVGANISISPGINYYYGKPGDVDVEGIRAFSGWSQNVVDFSVGVTFH